MKFTEKWANSEEVAIHYLESKDSDNQLTTLVYVPGVLNFAEQSIGFLQEFAPRRTISLSLRGRGKSDAPAFGYSFYDHVKDLDAVIGYSKVKDYCLLAYSMGVPLAIEHASRSSNLKGLILCDYPARYPAIPESWAETILSRSYINKNMTHVVENIQKESQSLQLYHQLQHIHVPVLIIKGGTEGSLLTGEESEKYGNSLKNVHIIELSDSGHELWNPEMEKFVRVIDSFLKKLDL